MPTSTFTCSLPNGRIRRQLGVTLVVSLIFLLLLTILGVTAMNTSTLQEKMAGNLRDQDMALQAAESALRDGESALNGFWVGGRPTSDATCSTGICALGVALPLDETYWTAHGIEYGGANRQLESVADPHYMIEEYQPAALTMTQCKYSTCPMNQYYRIYARGVGTTANSRVILETTYRIRN